MKVHKHELMNTQRKRFDQALPRAVRHTRSVVTVSFAVLTLMLASGCKTVHGVGRSVKVQQLPNKMVVEASLRDIPKITQIHHYPANAGHAEKFYYQSGELSGVIELAHEENGANTLFLYSYWINHTPSWPVLDRTRALMDTVYASLRQHAPDLPPPSELKEVLVRPPER
jgi:predicted small secreted protein